jgi:hypothetical protein
MYPSVRDHPSLSIHVEFQPFGHEIGLGIGEPDMARGNQYAGQRLKGHVIGRQTQGALVDHHRAISFVDF